MSIEARPELRRYLISRPGFNQAWLCFALRAENQAMYPEPGPVRAVDQRIIRYSFSPMRLKIHSAVRVWFAISRQVTRDTWVPRIC
jgi:hypothetical protein